MNDLIGLMMFSGVGVGIFSITTSLIFLIVAMCVDSKLRQRAMLTLAGKFFLAGIMLFMIGFGSCVLAFNL